MSRLAAIVRTHTCPIPDYCGMTIEQHTAIANKLPEPIRNPTAVELLKLEHPVVYASFDNNGRPLYIGVAKNAASRLGGHHRDFCNDDGVPRQHWIEHAEHIELYPFMSRTKAGEWEQFLIFHCLPTHNIHGRPDCEAATLTKAS